MGDFKSCALHPTIRIVVGPRLRWCSLGSIRVLVVLRILSLVVRLILVVLLIRFVLLIRVILLRIRVVSGVTLLRVRVVPRIGLTVAIRVVLVLRVIGIRLLTTLRDIGAVLGALSLLSLILPRRLHVPLTTMSRSIVGCIRPVGLRVVRLLDLRLRTIHPVRMFAHIIVRLTLSRRGICLSIHVFRAFLKTRSDGTSCGTCSGCCSEGRWKRGGRIGRAVRVRALAGHPRSAHRWGDGVTQPTRRGRSDFSHAWDSLRGRDEVRATEVSAEIIVVVCALLLPAAKEEHDDEAKNGSSSKSSNNGANDCSSTKSTCGLIAEWFGRDSAAGVREGHGSRVADI